VLVVSDSERLAEYVNEDIGEGWRPLGGVAMSVYLGRDDPYPHYRFAQAMVKDD